MEELVFKSEKGTPVTNSLLVAQKFGKQHKDVLRTIDNVIAQTSENQSKRNFAPSEYTDLSGKSNRMYIMTKDGFSILVMGFTGESAMDFKWEFIEAFNKMEAIIKTGNFQVPGSFSEALLLAARQAAQIELQQKELKEASPKVEYYDQCLESKGYLTVNMIASELGISHIKLNKLLCEWEIQYKQSDCYFLHSQYRDKGYTVHRPHPYINSKGETVTAQHMYWTEKGKKFIVELYHKKIAA